MKRIFILFISVIVICEMYAQANIKFEKSLVDVGSISIDSVYVTGKMKYYNSGNEPLYLISWESTCPCTTTEINEEPLLPGDSTFILIKHTFRGVGEFEHHVRLYYNRQGEKASSNWISIVGNAE